MGNAVNVFAVLAALLTDGTPTFAEGAPLVVGREQTPVEQRGLGASRPQGSGRANGERWAVVVGISDYGDQNIRALEYADRDARAFYDFLLSDRAGDGGFAQDHVRLLLNADATYERIRSALRTFLRSATDDDFVVIYFAGHGVPDPDRLDELYLLAHDTRTNDLPATAVPMDEVAEATRRLYARNVLVLVDACHSAGVGGQAGRRGLGSTNRINDAFLQELTRSSGGMAVFTASQATQQSEEGPQWGGGHGVFTHHVLEALSGAADADSNAIVTLGEMTEWVRARVSRATNNRQIPSISQTVFDPNWPLSVVDASAAASSAGAAARSDTSPNMPSRQGATDGVLPRTREEPDRRPSILIFGALAAATSLVAVVWLFGRRRVFQTATVAGTTPVATSRGGAVAAAQTATATESLASDVMGPPAPESRPRPLSAESPSLGDRYRIESELARAGSSIVYAANDTRLNRPVIVKVFHASTSEANQTERFFREIRLLARLQHPGIVPLYDHGSAGDAVFYVMPRLAGETLRSKMDREGPLAIGDAIRITAQIAEALDYAHRQAVLHRNVRPESIWLTRSQALIGEFGLAKAFGVAAIGALTTVGSASLGSAHYSSPEQVVAGRDLDPRSDIYGLGCVLYEMTTGRVPYRLATGEIDRRAKFSGPPVKASTLRAGVPSALDDVIEMAMHPDVERRYGSAIELARKLSALTAA